VIVRPTCLPKTMMAALTLGQGGSASRLSGSASSRYWCFCKAPGRCSFDALHAVSIVTSSDRAAISRSMCAVTLAWKQGASRHYVESGQPQVFPAGSSSPREPAWQIPRSYPSRLCMGSCGSHTLSCYHCDHVYSTNLGPGVLCAKREIRIRLRIARRGFACT
jgi:hypothetical protein